MAWLRHDHEGSHIASTALPNAPTSYDPFGNPENGIGRSYRGELQYADRIHLRNRDYDPSTGTFLSKDPLGVGAEPEGRPTSANLFAYVGNDPLNFLDPLGLCRVTDVTFVQDWGASEPDAWVPDGGDSGPGYDECSSGDGSFNDVLCLETGPLYESDEAQLVGERPLYNSHIVCGPHEYADWPRDPLGDLDDWLEYHLCRAVSAIDAKCGPDPSRVATAVAFDEEAQACGITLLTAMPGGAVRWPALAGDAVMDLVLEWLIHRGAIFVGKTGIRSGTDVPKPIACAAGLADHLGG